MSDSSHDSLQLDDTRLDPVISQLMSKLPASSRDSFSNEQLMALKTALGASDWGHHAIDIRGRFSFWKSQYYYVFLTGRNRRPLPRRTQELATLATSFLIAALWTVAVLSGLLALYLIKSALGINVFKNFSFGIWGWFKQTFL